MHFRTIFAALLGCGAFACGAGGTSYSSSSGASFDSDGAVPDVDAPRDAAPSDAGPKKDVLFAVCYSDLMAGNLVKTLRFAAQVAPQGGAGSVSITLYPLPKDGRTVSQAPSLGSPLVFSNVSLGANGAFSTSLASVDIPGGANPFSGADVTFSPFTLAGNYQADAPFCAALVSKITKPITNDFSGTCLFLPQATGDGFGISATGDVLTIAGGTLRVSDFTCPK